MKIKTNQNFNQSSFLRVSFISIFKGKLFWFSALILIAFSAFSFTLILYGANLQKNQTAAKVQQLIYNAIETKLDFFPNYLSGLFASPDTLFIDLDFEGVQLLNFARESALSKGIITEEEQKISVEANLTIGSEVFKVKLSPTGQNLDMIGNINKRAYKVRVLEGKKIFGMEEFKLLPPISRHNVVEWVGHEFEKKEGLIALRYFFVEMYLNGENLGVYAIEEHFNKELLENRQAREGIIFSAKPNELKIFNENKISKNQNKSNQIKFLKSALQGYKNNQITVERLFDLEKFASHFAIIDLMDGYHAVGFNSLYYFNPITNLIEPITREYNSLRYSDGQPNVNKLMIEISQGDGEGWAFSNSLFNNDEFISLYLLKLKKLSNTTYLNNFFEDIDKNLNQLTNILYRDDPFYKFPKEFLYERQIQMRSWFDKDLDIIANVDEDNKAALSIELQNNSLFPIEIMSIHSQKKNYKSTISLNVLPGKKISFSVDNLNNFEPKDLMLTYKIAGFSNKARDLIVVPKSFKTGITLSKLWNHSKNDELLKNSEIDIDYSKNIISFKKNSIDIDKDWFIPENFIVEGKPGLKINLQDGASIFSKSAFNFIGSKENPIKIVSSSQNGGGVFISDSVSQSQFSNTIFTDLSSPNIGESGITASLTFYKTAALLKNCSFLSNRSEDYLNLVHSEYELIDSNFISVHSDALDSDFSNGKISNSFFKNIGNDAMDFSGSIADVSKIKIDGVGDKAISAGEISKIKGNNITISNAEIAITSKDLSEVIINDIEIHNSSLGFAVFQKKPEYGPGFATINNLKLHFVDTTHLVEINSKLSFNQNEIMSKLINVEGLLYGANFGKKSN